MITHDLFFVLMAVMPVLAYHNLKHLYTRIPGYFYSFAIAAGLYGVGICSVAHYGIIGEIAALSLLVPIILMSGWCPGYSLVSNMAGMSDIRASLNYISIYALSGSGVANNYAQSLRETKMLQGAGRGRTT